MSWVVKSLNVQLVDALVPHELLFSSFTELFRVNKSYQKKMIEPQTMSNFPSMQTFFLPNIINIHLVNVNVILLLASNSLVAQTFYPMTWLGIEV